MKKKLVGIIVCMLLFTTVLPLSGTVIVEKNTMPTIYDGSLLGYVNDTLMDPIEGALVRVYFHETYEEDYSDGSGYYHVTNIPICYCLKNCTASKEGYKTEWVLLGISENTTHDFILMPNQPPEAPSISGETNGEAGTSYPYTFTSTNPDGDDVKYYIEWGDGNDTGWISFSFLFLFFPLLSIMRA